MKRVILILILCVFFSQDVFAGNKGIFEKGCVNSEKLDYDIYFTLDDVNGKQVQVTLSEIYRLLRSIRPKISDRVYQKSKEIPEGNCPVCNSAKRLTYTIFGDEREYEDFAVFDNITFYICGDCGNVYAIKNEED